MSEVVRQLGRLRKIGGRASPSIVNPYLRFASPGHTASPIPVREIVASGARREGLRQRLEVPGVRLRATEQVQFCRAAILEFGALPDADRRYRPDNGRPDNGMFGYADARSTYAIMRRFKPKRIIEIGSGQSSALLLDTCDTVPELAQTELTFIEPDPVRLKPLLTPADWQRCDIRQSIVQDAPSSLFAALEADDILFIDSSHATKTGRDVEFLLRDVVPTLTPGVLVHINDISWPFELPEAWIGHGHAWNEAHAVRAFLQFNDSFDIELFNAYLRRHHAAVFAGKLPEFTQSDCGSLWIRRTR